MNFFSLAFKNLLRRKIRTILTIIGIGIVIAIFFSLISFNAGYSRSLGNEFLSFGIHILAVPKGCPYEATSLLLHGGEMDKTLTYAQFEEIAKNEFVDIASPLLLIRTTINSPDYETALYGISDSLFELKPYWKLNGSKFSSLNANEAIIGANLAKELNLKIGSKVYLTNNKVETKIVGILSITGTSDDNFIYVPLKYSEKLAGKSDSLTAVAIKVKQGAKIGMVSNMLAQIPDVQTVTFTQVQSTLNGLVSTTQQLLLVATIFTLLIGLVSLVNTLYMSISERKKELGMLKAIGARNSQIFFLIITETIIIVLVAALLGVALSIGFSSTIEYVIRQLIENAPPGRLAYYTSSTLILTVLISALIGVLSSIFPAYSATKIPPMEVIRNE
ncbi:MAG TPA: ABC transporter permease [Caldisericia bacterium]|mgnify:FL=1|nr:ABC transporter permease [Caldisericia bacterium]HXK70430.1 ABC transporter permease [Caldisericia bacterium]